MRRADDGDGLFVADHGRDAELRVVSDPDAAGVIALGEPDLDGFVRRRVVGHEDDRDAGSCKQDGEDTDAERGELSHGFSYLPMMAASMIA